MLSSPQSSVLLSTLVVTAFGYGPTPTKEEETWEDYINRKLSLAHQGQNFIPYEGHSQRSCHLPLE